MRLLERRCVEGELLVKLRRVYCSDCLLPLFVVIACNTLPTTMHLNLGFEFAWKWKDS